jgi:hypothetical protein
MSKPYTAEEFSDQITDDRSWRLREISDLKNAVLRADRVAQRVLLRGMVAICYAHWEGHVRFSAKKYLEHVALRRIAFDQLDRQFYKNYFLPRLVALSATKTSHADRCTLVDEILNSQDRRFSKVNDDLINTKANLNFEVFIDICLVCGVPTEWFAQKQTFIDAFLLKRRNSIAHGEETYIDSNDLDDLATETISLMRAFGDELEKLAVLKTYRVQAIPQASTTAG